MPAAGSGKFVLDTNCFVDASRGDEGAAAFAEFCARAAPRLYLSTVVAAELRAGAESAKHRRTLERETQLFGNQHLPVAESNSTGTNSIT